MSLFVSQQVLTLTKYLAANIPVVCVANVKRLQYFHTTCKYERRVKIPRKLKVQTYDFVDNKQYGLYAASSGYIKEAAIERARLAIMRRTNKKGIILPVCESPFTKKPEGSRMGGGKGKVDHWAYKAEAGQVIIEYDCENELDAKQAFKGASSFFSVKTFLRVRPEKGRQVLSVSNLVEMYLHDAERKKRIGNGEPLHNDLEGLKKKCGIGTGFIHGIPYEEEEYEKLRTQVYEHEEEEYEKIHTQVYGQEKEQKDES